MAEVLIQRSVFKFNPYLAIAVIYFFLNSLFLPEGLQYTIILTPLFLWWLWKEDYKKLFAWFLMVTALYGVIHFFIGVQPYYYLRSWFLAFCSFTFAITIHHFLKKKEAPEIIFEKITLLNIGLVPIAIASLFFPPLNEYFWSYKSISPGVQSFPRLSMLTYEASYYSLLLAPLFLYYLMKVIFNKTGRPIWFLLALIIPLALSLSFGVIAVMVITAVFVLIVYYKDIFGSRKNSGWILICAFAIGLAASMAVFLYPDNPIYQRIYNVLHNKDTSIRGRTFEAFHLANWIASEKSRIFGVGFGQIKVVGHDIIINYYKYYDPHPVVRIPNTLAETLAMFGIVGLVLRFILEGFLFFSTKVYSNIYRLTVFVFIFIYQFTGSFMLNIVELVLWAIAFTPAFYQFNIEMIRKKKEV